MTGTITYILSRAGFRAMNGPLADERRRMAGAEPPAAYVSYDPRLLAGAGWYGYRIALKGGDRQMVERARYMLSERYVIRDGYEYYDDGVYVFGVLLRERVPRYGIGGGAPTPEPEALNFYMPNGGTISLNKTGNPTVVELEYSLDRGATWTVWQEDANGNRSLGLNAGQRMYVRNTSEISTGFSTGSDNYYCFFSSHKVYAKGNIDSLLCKNVSNAVHTNYCFLRLFTDFHNLQSSPDFSIQNIAVGSYDMMFVRCINIESIYVPLNPRQSSYYFMCYGCTNLREIKTDMTDVSATSCIYNWLGGVSPTGDFYCPAELTIPTGDSGIPSGWTRHDI